MGEVFPKVASLACLEGVRDELRDHFEPLQLAICAPGGAERLLHRFMAALSAGGDDVAALLVDSQNAFNSADRDRMLEMLYGQPQLAPLFGIAHFGYGHGPSQLGVLDDDGQLRRISSEEGSRQGCVLGTLLFCLGLHPSLVSATDGLQLTAGAFADDFTAIGAWQRAVECFDRLHADPNVHVNLIKTKILWPHVEGPPQELLDAAALRGVGVVHGGIKCLGGMLALDHNGELLQQHVIKAANKCSRLFESILDPRLRRQSALHIIRSCAQPMMGYLTRVIPYQYAYRGLTQFDQALLKVAYNKLIASDAELAQVGGAPPPPPHQTAIKKMLLPMREGGLGLRPTERTSAIAYYAAAVQASRDTAPFESAHLEPPNYLGHRHAWEKYRNAAYFQIKTRYQLPTKENDTLAEGDPAALLPAHPHTSATFYAAALLEPSLRLQHELTRQAEQGLVRRFLDGLPLPDQVRIECMRGHGGREARAWLLETGADLRNVLRDSEVRDALRFMLGLGEPNVTHCGRCHTRVDGAGDDGVPADPWHAHVCPKFRRREITLRHDALRNLVTRLCQDAAVLAFNELAPDGPNFPERLRPDGTQYFQHSMPVSDITVRHLAGPSNIQRGNVEACLKLLDEAARAKHTKYDGVAAQLGASMYALVLDSHGRLHREFRCFLRHVTSHAVAFGRCEPDQAPAYFRSLVTRISRSVAVRRTNARVHAAFAQSAVRQPPPPPPVPGLPAPQQAAPAQPAG
jgi:hypothetical protein